jgi:hypothetical protein
MKEYPKTGIVTYMSIFLQSIGFSSVRTLVDIEVLLIPFFDFIVRKELLPRSNAFFCQFR